MVSTGFDLSNRVFKLVILFIVFLAMYWGFKAYEILTSVTGNYVREISVDAEGTAYVVPDTAVIRLGVSTEGASSEAVVSENTDKMNKVLEAIKGLGIEESKIQTTSYYLTPDYTWDENGNETTTGYTLDQTVEVRLQDFEKIGDLIAAANTAGANTVSGIEFTLEDPETAKTEARTEAIASAKAKAQQIAMASGLRLGDMVSYYEYSSYYEGKGGYMDYYAESADMMSVPSIEPGQEEITLTVTLTYQIR